MKFDEASLALWCIAAYENPAALARHFGDDVAFFPLQRGGAEAYVLKNNKTTVVVCRGTQWRNPIDLWFDLQFLAPQPVHRGFKRAANRIIEEGLWDLILNVESVWFIGHSLGGAIANVLADQAIGKCGKVNIMTIGQPRVATTEWAAALPQKIKQTGGQFLRFVNPLDPIPRLPPAGQLLFPDYRHSEGLHLLTDSNQVIPYATQSEKTIVTMSELIRRPLKAWRAHAAQTYYDHLCRWVEFRHQNGMQPLVTQSSVGLEAA